MTSEKKSCRCKGNCCSKNKKQVTIISDHCFKILETGDAECKVLETNLLEACKALHLLVSIVYVREAEIIALYGNPASPALFLDDELVSSGQVLSVEEIKEIILVNI